jgi:hypothetical protein
MGWVKLDDGFAMHPKVLRVSDAAVRAHIEALCYAAKYETDGVVPDQVAANGPVRAELMASGLWENGPASIVIHDYLVYNPSHTEKERKRNSVRTNRASREGDGLGYGLGLVGSGNAVEDVGSEKVSGFDAFWAIYPRKVGKPKARAAFDTALRRASTEDIILGAKRYAEDPNREDEFTAHPTTWLHRDGWNDPPLPKRKQRKHEGVLDQSAREALEGINAKRRGRRSGHRSAGELSG